MDYAATYLLAGPLVALTLGQLGPASDAHPAFLTQLHQPNGPLVGFALAGGVCLSLGGASAASADA